MLIARGQDISMRVVNQGMISITPRESETTLVTLFFMLIARGQGISMRVVNQGMISITPRESLGPDSEMVIGDEFGSSVLRSVTHSEGIVVSEDDDGDASEEEGFFPQLPAIRI